MKQGTFFMFLSIAIISFLIVLGTGLVEYKIALQMNKRVETALSVACFGGFAFYDLEHYAHRKALDKKEVRLVVLEDSSRVKEKITELVIKNLRLNDDLTPKEDSYMIGSIEIVEINIYNPDDLPVTLEGREYHATTIELIARVPFKMPLGEVELKEKRIIVNADTFLVSSQTN